MIDVYLGVSIVISGTRRPKPTHYPSILALLLGPSISPSGYYYQEAQRYSQLAEA
ncbi:hypothetical protein YC2023_083324 [Brassica napus]